MKIQKTTDNQNNAKQKDIQDRISFLSLNLHYRAMGTKINLVTGIQNGRQINKITPNSW